jgi:hypothetical protein
VKIKNLEGLKDYYKKLGVWGIKDDFHYNSLDKEDKDWGKFKEKIYDDIKHDYYKKWDYLDKYGDPDPIKEINGNDDIDDCWEKDVPWQSEILAKPFEATKEDIEKDIKQQEIEAEKLREKQLKEQQEKEKKLREKQAEEQRLKAEREQQLKEQEQIKRVEEIASTHVTGEKLQELKEALIDEE